MWVDDDGVAHTVAVPRPESMLPDWAMTALLNASDHELQSAFTAIEQRMDELFDEIARQMPVNLAAEEAYVESAPHHEFLMKLSPASKQGLEPVVERLAEIDFRWRLDGLSVLSDAVWERLGDGD